MATVVKVEEERDGSNLGSNGEGRAGSGDGVDLVASLKRAASKRVWEILAA
jgi:hypothetical protein